MATGYEQARSVVAALAGTLAAPVTLAKAGAPLGAAVVYVTSGYPLVLAAVAALCLLAAVGIRARAAQPCEAAAHVTA
ncbi:hypothetical protein [Actinoplanes solisilvae]|uniref:hypothetical protein n=1 Tax=Actinoplanes solisilvae TaxID=2486853 RepID=UPI000FD6DFA7|nr:hypothetical protein [Actinoplanes solisilvae]